MTRHVLLAALAVALAASPAVSETAPSDVKFEEGAVAASLTGTPGNPEEGKKIMSTNALGNCVACHQIAAMPDVPFHGDIAPALDGAASRWSEAQLRGIVGLRLPITRIEAKKKMSQNRSEADRRGVAQGLAASDRPQERAAAVLIPR